MSDHDFPEIPIPTLQPGKQRLSWKGFEKSKQALVELAQRPGITAREVEAHYGLGKNQIAVWKQNRRGDGEGADASEGSAAHKLAARKSEIRAALATKKTRRAPAPSVGSVVAELRARRAELLEEREAIDARIRELDGEIREAIAALESLVAEGVVDQPPPADPNAPAREDDRGARASAEEVGDG